MMDVILLDTVECTPTKWLTPEDLYGAGYERGTFIWTPPPPAAADLALVEQLGRVRLKHLEAMHLVVVPCVMTQRWQRHMT
jgi:hypothetical protein